MATTTNYQTPGVYVQYLDAFPNTIVGVPTAVPAFIGYTYQAQVSGQSVLNVPVSISSMADYTLYFGGPPAPNYEITTWTSPPSSPEPANPDFTVQYNGTTLPYYVTENSLFILYYCMKLYFANGGTTCYVVSVGTYGDPNASGYATTPAIGNAPPSASTATGLLGGLYAIGNQVGPTILVIPEAIQLDNTDYTSLIVAMVKQAATLGDRVALIDVYNANTVTQANVTQILGGVVQEFYNDLGGLVGSDFVDYLSYGIAYFPFLNTSIVNPTSLDYTYFNQSETQIPITKLSPDEVLSPTVTTPTAGKITSELQEILTLFNMAQYPNSTSQKTQEQVQYYIDLAYGTSSPGPGHNLTVTSLNTILTSQLPAYQQLLQIAAAKTNVLPPSPAMAGIYCLTDSNQGVWNAPANVPVAATLSPTVNLTDALQGPLNVPVNGEAIDVIRSFPGRGTVVWGARTLEGNSGDFRYIQVRRTVIYIEQSIKNAIAQFVFAPNVAATWTQVTQMINGFLQNLWSQGGLVGSKASEAFIVQCGVPTTMTSTDVLNGLMIVQVTLQMVRPAEFIQLQFTQTMS